MVKRMFEQPWRPNLLAGEPEITPFGFNRVIPPISNIDCLSDKPGKEPTPPRKARTFPEGQSFNPLRPCSGTIPRKPYKFTILPPISQIDFFSSRTPGDSNKLNDFTNGKFPISNVTCLNADELPQGEKSFEDVLPSGRMIKKDHGIRPYDSEYIKLSKSNGRKDLLRPLEISNKSTGSTPRDFTLTQRRTILRSPDKRWQPSDWVKFKVYGKGQLR